MRGGGRGLWLSRRVVIYRALLLKSALVRSKKCPPHLCAYIQVARCVTVETRTHLQSTFGACRDLLETRSFLHKLYSIDLDWLKNRDAHCSVPGWAVFYSEGGIKGAKTKQAPLWSYILHEAREGTKMPQHFRRARLRISLSLSLSLSLTPWASFFASLSVVCTKIRLYIQPNRQRVVRVSVCVLMHARARVCVCVGDVCTLYSTPLCAFLSPRPK